MQNNYAVSIVIGFLCFAWTPIAAAEPVFANKIDSGLEVGAEVAAWEPVHLTGPYSGTKTCPVCTHVKQPVILAFAKWGKDTGAMMLYFERLAAKYREHNLNVYLVLIDGDPSEVKRLARKHGIEKVSICQLDGQTRQDDLELYKIAPAADNTVMMYRNFRVCSSMANVTAEDLKAFDDDVFRALQHPDAAETVESTASRDTSRHESATDSNSRMVRLSGDNTSIEFIGKAGPNSQKGSFKEIRGQLNFPTDEITDARVEISVQMDSVTTEHELLTKHLKGEAFFDVANFPTATFISNKIEKASDPDRYLLRGVLTIHGIEREVAVPAKMKRDTDAFEFASEFTIQQSEFSMNQSFPQSVDEVQITLRAKLDRTAGLETPVTKAVQRNGGRVAKRSRITEENAPQIVGTWEWALDIGPEGQKAKMVVREKGGKLSALVTAPDGKEVMSEDFALKEGRVTFTIRPEMGIMKMVMSHDGVLKGDEIIGTANMKGGFMRKESKWHARRVPEG